MSPPFTTLHLAIFSHLALEPADEAGLEGVLGSSITYRIAVGPQQGRKAFCLQSLPAAGARGFRGREAGETAGSRVDSHEIRGLCFLHAFDLICFYIVEENCADNHDRDELPGAWR